jgi:hypothetical protein
LTLVLNGCETWSPTLREEHRLRAFETRGLRRIFRPKSDEVIGGWRKLQNDVRHNLHSSPNTIKMIKSRSMIWAGHASRMEETRNIYGVLVGKISLGRLWRRWKDNIKVDFREMGWGGMD